MRDSEGGLSPAMLHCMSSAVLSPPAGQMLMDKCFTELFFLILAGVVSSVVLLFISQTWPRTSPALSRFLASFTRSFLIRSLAWGEILLHSLGWNSNLPCWMLLKRLIWHWSQEPPCAQPHC